MSKQIVSRSILAFLMLLPLSSCYTIYNWSDGPPSNPAKLNAEQKKRLFKRYAILRIQGNRVTTEAEPDTFYSLSSFTPVMERVSPEAKGPLEKARTMETMVTVGNTLTAIGALATVNTFSSYLIADNSTRQVINYVESVGKVFTENGLLPDIKVFWDTDKGISSFRAYTLCSSAPRSAILSPSFILSIRIGGS